MKRLTMITPALPTKYSGNITQDEFDKFVKQLSNVKPPEFKIRAEQPPKDNNQWKIIK